jgi:RNA polymerase sigma-70 factor (ECF subfamily)
VARRGRRQIPLSGHPDLDAVGAQVRTETLSILRTEKRTELEKLRDELSDEDRLLLILRVDRNMAWTAVAQVIGDLSTDDDPALRQEAARLRKRFQLLKERLRALGKQRGLIS